MKRLFAWFVALFGRQVRDERTGQLLGKAICLPWRGKVWLAGLHEPYVRPVFLPEATVRYGRHRLGFATHAVPDFPRLAGTPAPSEGGVTVVVLAHQSAPECDALVERWKAVGIGADRLLLAHGGAASDAAAVSHPHVVHVGDPRLRTMRHPVERQSYGGVFRAAAGWIRASDAAYVLFVEFDHVPLVADWTERLTAALHAEDADVLCHKLLRVDGTNAPHYLEHLSDPGFLRFWERISRREDKQVVLNCLGSGLFWSRPAFLAVADLEEDARIYLEMFLPTAAHHLGFRVRPVPSPTEGVGIHAVTETETAAARKAGEWSVHPWKDLSRWP